MAFTLVLKFSNVLKTFYCINRFASLYSVHRIPRDYKLFHPPDTSKQFIFNFFIRKYIPKDKNNFKKPNNNQPKNPQMFTF